jgi:hypothetical protein
LLSLLFALLFLAALVMGVLVGGLQQFAVVAVVAALGPCSAYAWRVDAMARRAPAGDVPR